MTEVTNTVVNGVEEAKDVISVVKDVPKSKNGLIIAVSAATVVVTIWALSTGINKIRGHKDDISKEESIPEPTEIKVEE